MALRLAVLALSLALLVPSVSGQEPDKGRDSATYVFLGTVPSQGGSRTSQDGGVLVTVNEVYFQKGTFADQTGRQVEVLGAAAGLQEKGSYLFYTEPVRFGERVAVRLIDLADASGSAARQQGARMKQDLSDAFVRREIAERAALAELVVVGTVTHVRPLERGRAAESEHDAGFHVARLKVEQALKGRPASDVIEFVFAMSKDVQWYLSPKFRQGARGVFLLQRPEPAIARLGIERQRFVVLNPLDFRPPAQIMLAEAALKGVR